MSTTSMGTASAELDPTLSDDTVIVTQICILIASQGDDTPLDPTSFREEDAIKLCVGLGQEHLEGVLWVSDAKIVLVFSSDPSMMAALQCFGATMTWHDDPAWHCIWPPTTVQVRDYFAAMSSHPSGALAPAWDEEVETDLPLVSPTPMMSPNWT